MKAKILKLAGVKSEAEFYKLYPTEESFMKVHGHKLMNKYGPGGATTDGCGPGYSKNPLTGDCMPNGWVAPKNTQVGPTKEAGKENDLNYISNISKNNKIQANPQNPTTVSRSYSDEPWRKRQVAEIKRNEAMRNSELAQSFAGLTPSGNLDAGLIGAQMFANMNPLTGSLASTGRLTQTVLGQNPYDFNLDKPLSWQNVGAGLGLLGDATFAYSSLKPGVSTVFKNADVKLPSSNILKNVETKLSSVDNPAVSSSTGSSPTNLPAPLTEYEKYLEKLKNWKSQYGDKSFSDLAADADATITTEGQKIIDDLTSAEGSKRLREQFKLAAPDATDDQLDHLVGNRIREVYTALRHNKPAFYLTDGEGAINTPTFEVENSFFPVENAHYANYFNPYASVLDEVAPKNLFPGPFVKSNNLFARPDYKPGTITLGYGHEFNPHTVRHEAHGHALQGSSNINLLETASLPLEADLVNLVTPKNALDRWWFNRQLKNNPSFKKDYDYFISNKEAYPHLVENRSKMISQGVIDNTYDKITPSKLLKSQSLNESGDLSTRFTSLYPWWKFPKLAKIMNTAPAAVTAVAGAAALDNANSGNDEILLQQAYGGPLVDYYAGKMNHGEMFKEGGSVREKAIYPTGTKQPLSLNAVMSQNRMDRDNNSYSGGISKFAEGGLTKYQDKGEVTTTLTPEEIENKRLQELGSDAYSAMQPFYNTLYEAAQKYENPRTGLVSPFNSARASLKAFIKHPNVMFMKRHPLTNEKVYADPYNVGIYSVGQVGNRQKTFWPSEWAEPRKEHDGTILGDWFNKVRTNYQEKRDERKNRRGRGKTGCWGANCYENEISTAAIGGQANRFYYNKGYGVPRFPMGGGYQAPYTNTSGQYIDPFGGAGHGMPSTPQPPKGPTWSQMTVGNPNANPIQQPTNYGSIQVGNPQNSNPQQQQPGWSYNKNNPNGNTERASDGKNETFGKVMAGLGMVGMVAGAIGGLGKKPKQDPCGEGTIWDEKTKKCVVKPATDQQPLQQQQLLQQQQQDNFQLGQSVGQAMNNDQGIAWNYNPNIQAGQIQNPTSAPLDGPSLNTDAGAASSMARYGGNIYLPKAQTGRVKNMYQEMEDIANTKQKCGLDDNDKQACKEAKALAKLPDAVAIPEWDDISNIENLGLDKKGRKALEKEYEAAKANYPGLDLPTYVAATRDAGRTNTQFANTDRYSKYFDPKTGALLPNVDNRSIDPFMRFYRGKFPTQSRISSTDVLNTFSNMPGGLSNYSKYANVGYVPPIQRYGGDIFRSESKSRKYSKFAEGGLTGPEDPYHPLTNPTGYRDKNVVERLKKLPNKEERYEPSQLVNDVKAGLSAWDMATSSGTQPWVQAANWLARVANSTGDGYTALRYAIDGQGTNAAVDAGEAVLDLIPYRQGKREGINLSKTNPDANLKFSKLDKSLNRILRTAKAGAQGDDFMHSSIGRFLFGNPDSKVKYNNGGDISIPQLPTKNSPLLQFYYNNI